MDIVDTLKSIVSLYSGSVEGSVNIAPSRDSLVEDEIDDDDFGFEPKQDITQIHVTTLDAVCSVS